MTPCSRQEITEEDIAEVEKVLRSDFLTQGSIVPEFEKSAADYCRASHAIAVYENLGFEKNNFAQAEDFYRKAISIPIHPSLKETQQSNVIDMLKKILKK
jgi:dTDP-4-amino-4,6-dideoxygalactose transaminase